jgi:hypothetical protein
MPTLNQNTTGSAATLTTPRKINNIPFDGSADIALHRLDYISGQVQTMPRHNTLANAVGGLATQVLYAAYFTADQTVTINNLTSITGSTAAAATPTLCRMGIYSVDGSDNLAALLAGTTNDTTLWAAANTSYTKALGSGVALTAGTRYAMTLLCVSVAALPSFAGLLFPASANTAGPRLVGYKGAQSDLPASASSLGTSSGGLIYMRGS